MHVNCRGHEECAPNDFIGTGAMFPNNWPNDDRTLPGGVELCKSRDIIHRSVLFPVKNK